jgi:hypothetical protein
MAANLCTPEHQADAVRMVVTARGSVAKVAKSLGRLKLAGQLCPDADRPFTFQRVEGELNGGTATRVSIGCRTLTEDVDEDAAVIDAWMVQHDGVARKRTAHRDSCSIYWPVTLPQPTPEHRSVDLMEERLEVESLKFKTFEGTGSGRRA